MATSIAATGSMTADYAAIASGLKRQDPELLDTLIETYQHRIMRYLIYLTGQRDEAEDLFQELWLRVLRSGSSYNGTASFETWLHVIARNLVIDLRRRRRVSSLDELRPMEEGERSFDVAEERPSPLDSLQCREKVENLNSAMQALDSRQREVLTLRFEQELPLSDIALITKTPLCTVKSRLYRGIAALKKHLEGFYLPN